MNPGGTHLWMSRPLAAGAFTFLVGSTDAAVKDRVEGLFHDLPTPKLSDGEVECFVLTPSPAEAGRWDLSGPLVGTMNRLTLAEAVTMLMTGINLAALGAEPERLHLHAGAAVRDGYAVVMSAPRETGKTTTLARLVLHGWSFISDEAVSIGPDDQVRGFAKPLSIKPRGRHLLPELEAHMVPSPFEAGDDAVLHVALGAAGGTACVAAEPRMVVLLRRDAGTAEAAHASAADVHPVDAVVRLMGETMDAGRYGARAIVELARLAARCRCHDVLVGEPAETVALIEELFAAPDVEPLPVQELEGGRVRSHVASLLVGDRVVIHEQPEGRVLALDAMASQIWLTLAGRPAGEHIDLDGPVVAPFVERLVALGLVSGPNSADGRDRRTG